MSRVPARSVHPAAFLWWRRRAQSRMHPFSGWPRRALSNPTADWLAQQIVEAFPWGTAPSYLIRDNDGAYGQVFTGRRGQWEFGIARYRRDRPGITHTWSADTAARLSGSCADLWQTAFAAGSNRVLDLLQRDAHASWIEQGRASTRRCPAIWSWSYRANPIRIAPSLCADMIFGNEG